MTVSNFVAPLLAVNENRINLAAPVTAAAGAEGAGAATTGGVGFSVGSAGAGALGVAECDGMLGDGTA